MWIFMRSVKTYITLWYKQEQKILLNSVFLLSKGIQAQINHLLVRDGYKENYIFKYGLLAFRVHKHNTWFFFPIIYSLFCIIIHPLYTFFMSTDWTRSWKVYILWKVAKEHVCFSCTFFTQWNKYSISVIKMKQFQQTFGWSTHSHSILNFSFLWLVPLIVNCLKVNYIHACFCFHKINKWQKI